MVEGLWGQPTRSDHYEPMGGPGPQEFGSDAHELFAMFGRRKWLFAAITSAGMMLAVLLLGACWRALLKRRLGGTTGDTAGALVELGEALALVGLIWVNGPFVS